MLNGAATVSSSLERCPDFRPFVCVCILAGGEGQDYLFISKHYVKSSLWSYTALSGIRIMLMYYHTADKDHTSALCSSLDGWHATQV